MGYERVSLYGLTIVEKRRIDFARIDAEAAREIFVRSALVEGELRTPAPFQRHNAALVGQIEALQERSRRRDLLVDEQAIYAFYDRLVPANVHSAAGFERWRKQLESKNPRALFLRREDILLRDPSDVTESEFPDALDVSGLRLPLHYRFEPGHPEDGVTVTLPLASLHELSPGRFDWLVPGLLLEKSTALLESLPKSIRKNFVPVRETAERCAKGLTPADTPLAEALAAELERATRVRVPPEAFRPESCPPHLSMNFRVVDQNGKVVGVSRDFGELLERLGVPARESFRKLPKSGVERDRVTAWDFGDLPRSVDVPHGRFALPGFPALVAEGNAVALRVLPTESAAESAHRAGLRRLYALRLGDVVKHIRRGLPGIQGMTLWFSLVGTGDVLRDDIVDATIDRACIGDAPLARTARAFEESAERARGRLAAVAGEICERVATVLSAYHEAMRDLPPAAHASKDPHADIRGHVATLVYPGFVTSTPWAQLPHLARYLKAVKLRIARMREQPQKDRERSALLAPLLRQYEERAAMRAREGLRDPELERYRWLLEEWRVSLFAQELKTREPVSERRLADQWLKVAP
jgi:ATP-dependent helicase HrpA